MLAILVMLLVGLIIGVLAQAIAGRVESGSVLVTIALGFGGALIASFLGRLFGWYQTPWDGPGIIASTLGAIALILIIQPIRRHA